MTRIRYPGEGRKFFQKPNIPNRPKHSFRTSRTCQLGGHRQEKSSVPVKQSCYVIRRLGAMRSQVLAQSAGQPNGKFFIEMKLGMIWLIA